jgi:hypothetical protein
MDKQLNKQLKCVLKNKKFITVFATTNELSTNDMNNTIKFKLDNIFLPFGVESFNNKYILNLELESTSNTHNNYISTLLSLEKKILEKKYNSEINIESVLVNKKFVSSIKDSKLGNILRTHITDSTKIFILKKDSSKMDIDKENLKGTTTNLIISLKGLWVNDDTYGFYWNVNSVQITKFN